MSRCPECPFNHRELEVFVKASATVAYDLTITLYPPSAARNDLLEALHGLEGDWYNSGFRDPATLQQQLQKVSTALRAYKPVSFGLIGLIVNGVAKLTAAAMRSSKSSPRR